MRRAFASLLLSISLVFATLSWSGFILGRTVFDPGRSERLAEELLDNEEVRAVIVGRLADTINSAVPPEIPITDDQLNQVATTVLDDPRVEELIQDQLVVAHQNALNGVDEPVALDATAIGQASRESLIAEQPALAFLPEVPAAQITLPTTGFSWIGTINDYVRSVTWLSGLLAIAGICGSFLVSNRRSKIVRRLAYWAFGAAAFWIIAGFVAPWAFGLVSPESMILASAAINVFFGAMIAPAIFMAVVSLALFAISAFMPRHNKQRAAEQVAPSRRSRATAEQFELERHERQRVQSPQTANRSGGSYQTDATDLGEPGFKPTQPQYPSWDHNNPTAEQPRS